MTRTQFRTPTVGTSSEWAGLSHMRSGQLATNELIYCGGASIGMHDHELGPVRISFGAWTSQYILLRGSAR